MRTVSFCQDRWNPSLSRYFTQIIKQEKLRLSSSACSWHFVLIKCMPCRAIVLHIGVSWFLLGGAHASLPAILDSSVFRLIIHLLVLNKDWLLFFQFEDVSVEVSPFIPGPKPKLVLFLERLPIETRFSLPGG